MSILFGSPVSVSLRTAFGRAARLALLGLLVPPGLVSACALLGLPLRSGIETANWMGALAGFAASGLMAGRTLKRGAIAVLLVTAGFSIAGGAVTPAYRGLQGLSGLEPWWQVTAFVTGSFAAGFAVAGLAAALAVKLRIGPAVRTALLFALAGAGGGLIALLPWALAPSMLAWSPVVRDYARMALAVASFLGCLIAPYKAGGAILERALPSSAVSSLA